MATSSHSSTLQVQGTNDNSTLSKLSASQTGYFQDLFMAYFTLRMPRRAPLIHWGYWIRFQAINRVLMRFLTSEGYHENQILSLGAGFDSSYFRLKSQERLTNCHYYEVDYPAVVTRKRLIIESHPKLQEFVNNGFYNLIGCDITMIQDLEHSLKEAGLKADSPTLILAEVVLTYILPEQVDRILQWTSKFFSNAILCVYEQINPFDGFGQVMLRHFQSLSSPLLNIELYPSSHSQCQRYLNAGWSHVLTCDMNRFYYSIPEGERQRFLSLEPFDEYEEWHLKCSHYHLICASSSNNLQSLHVPTMTYREEAEDVMNEVMIECDENDNWQLNRYGHASVQLSEDMYLIYGGFGIKGPNVGHGRLDNLIEMKRSITNGKWNIEELKVSGNGPGRGLMHHSMTLLPSGAVLIIGGRASPQQPNSISYILSFNNMSNGWSWNIVQTKGDALEGRWRHSATPINDRLLMIVGGRRENGHIFNDILILDTQDWIVKKLPLCLPEGCHSHVAIGYENKVLVIGGLTENLRPLDSCLQLEQQDQTSDNNLWDMKSLELTPPIPAIYSMSGHVVTSHTVMLMGGVQVTSPRPSDVILIDIKLRTWSELMFKYPVGMSLPLLHGHTSHLLTNGDVVIIGGGGNCFSFGTHFNYSPLKAITNKINEY